MTAAGGDHGRHSEESNGLGAFSSEAAERISEAAERVSEPAERTAFVPPHAAGGASRRGLSSPVLVPVVVALAVVGYGGLTVLWWERDRPELRPSFSSTPTQSYQPRAPQPPAEPQPGTSANAPAAAAAVSEAPPADLFVPAVARVESAPRPVEGALASRAGRVLPPPAPPVSAEDVPPSLEPALPPSVADGPVAAALAPAGEAAVVAPPRSAESAAVERLTADRDAIGGVLQSYRAAYNALDATSASTIWQGLDTRALQRAFSTLSRQDVAFDRCDVRVTAADRAVASCRGVLHFVPKIGDGSPQQRRLSWSFDFQRAADRWVIASVTAK